MKTGAETKFGGSGDPAWPRRARTVSACVFAAILHAGSLSAQRARPRAQVAALQETEEALLRRLRDAEAALEQVARAPQSG